MSQTDSIVHFINGRHVGFVGADVVALVDVAPSADLVGRLWSSIATPGASVGDMVDEFARTGVRNVPSFVLVGREGGAFRVLIRGAIRVRVLQVSGEVIDMDGGSVTTWLERVVPDAVQVTCEVLGGTPGRRVEDGEWFMVQAGVVPAAAIDWHLGIDAARLSDLAVEFVAQQPAPVVPPPDPPAPPVARSGPPPFGAVEADQDRSAGVGVDANANADADVDLDVDVDLDLLAGVDAGVRAPDAEPDNKGAGVPESDTDEVVSDVGGTSDTGYAADDGRTLHATLTEIEPDPEPDHESAEAESVADDGDGPVMSGGRAAAEPDPGGYDHLFGATQFRSVEMAAVRPADDAADPGPAIIDSVPALGAVPAGGPDLVPEGDHDGMTIGKAEYERLRQGRSESSSPGSAVVDAEHVLGVLCGAGHASAPHASTCRVCGGPIPTQVPISMPRPNLGVLRFSFGAEVVLNGPLLIGRAPRLDGHLSGQIPELVTVPSPQGEISRVHLSVAVDEWQVRITDLSVNGTTLALPGRAPQRLHPRQPALIVPGAVIHLSEDVSCRYEAG